MYRGGDGLGHDTRAGRFSCGQLAQFPGGAVPSHHQGLEAGTVDPDRPAGLRIHKDACACRPVAAGPDKARSRRTGRPALCGPRGLDRLEPGALRLPRAVGRRRPASVAPGARRRRAQPARSQRQHGNGPGPLAGAGIGVPKRYRGCPQAAGRVRRAANGIPGQRRRHVRRDALADRRRASRAHDPQRGETT